MRALHGCICAALLCCTGSALSLGPGHVVSWRPPTNPFFPKPRGSPRADAVRMSLSWAGQTLMYSALPNTLVLLDQRAKRWLWETAVEYQLEEVQFELSHRSQLVEQKRGWFNINKKILATALMWPNSMFGVRRRLEVLAERFPNESEADACQRLTKSQELLYEMKASEQRYYRLLDECEELRTQRMFQAAHDKRELALRAMSQSSGSHLQHIKLLLGGELDGHRDLSPLKILDFERRHSRGDDAPEGTTACLEKSYAGAPATDTTKTTVADLLTFMDLRVLYLYTLL